MSQEFISNPDWPPPTCVECSHCGKSVPIAKAADWPTITNLDEPARKRHGVDALGCCPCALPKPESDEKRKGLLF